MTSTRASRVSLALVLAAAFLGGTANAQTAAALPSSAEPARGYVEVVAQSAFGNVTSQSYGAEVGATVWKATGLQVFGEFGQIRNVATSDLGVNAAVIAGFLSQVQSNVSFSVKEPVSFFAAGVKYPIVIPGSKIQPYVLGGFGSAKVTKQVAFTVGGSDVTSNLSQFGVVLGSDLSGEFSKAMLTLGGGAVWPIWHQVIADFQFRFSRIGAEDETAEAISVGRAGIGIGVRF